jgi:hypothetical protein
MAVNIFDKYGIKEVANVYFEALETDEKAGVYAGDIVLLLDTLKVSTIETTAENTAAQGGWGNPKLVQWDYGKEINITLEDALMSLESLRFMLGGAIKSQVSATEPIIVRHTEEVVCLADGALPAIKDHLTGVELTPTAKYGHPIRLINLTKGTRTQLEPASASADDITLSAGDKITFTNPKMISIPGENNSVSNSQAAAKDDHIRIFWEEILTGDSDPETAVEVTISPDTFPGTYKVVGDTFMRSEKTGKDEPFQFVINKAKVQSNVTITLQAEGDPSTFEMTLNVLRSTNERGENEMMKLVRYNIESGGAGNSGNDRGSVVLHSDG